MQAIAAFPEEKRIALVEHPEPVMRTDTEVTVRMIDVGICGTDREIARFEYGSPPPGSAYLVIGHESLGEVVRTGSAVRRVKTGDLVVMTVRRPCAVPQCPACRIGRPDFCVTGQYTERGIRAEHGFLTELVVEQERYVHVLPQALAAIGVLVEPLTVAEKALVEVVNVQDRLPWWSPAQAKTANAVILGAGPVGLLGTLALLVRGYECWVFSREASASEQAKWVESVGARYFSSTEHSVSDLARLVGNIDLVYEATGASNIAFEVLEMLGTNGVFIFTGVPGRKAPIELDANSIMRNLVLKNQIVYGTVNAGPRAFDRAIDDLQEFDGRWPVALRALIAARHPIDRASQLLFEAPPGIKHVVTFVPEYLES